MQRTQLIWLIVSDFQSFLSHLIWKFSQLCSIEICRKIWTLSFSWVCNIPELCTNNIIGLLFKGILWCYELNNVTNNNQCTIANFWTNNEIKLNFRHCFGKIILSVICWNALQTLPLPTIKGTNTNAHTFHLFTEQIANKMLWCTTIHQLQIVN